MDDQTWNIRKNRCPNLEERVELERAVEIDRQFLSILSDQLSSRIHDRDQKHKIFRMFMSLLKDAKFRQRDAMKLKGDLEKCLLPFKSSMNRNSHFSPPERSIEHSVPLHLDAFVAGMNESVTRPPKTTSGAIFSRSHVSLPTSSHQSDDIVKIRQETLASLKKNVEKAKQELSTINADISRYEYECQVASALYQASLLLIPEIKNQINVVKHTISIKQHRLRSIWKVSEDIWRDIFGFVALSTISYLSPDTYLSALTLSRVCHNWRLISRTHSILWSNITVNVGRFDLRCFERIKCYASLSSKLPLTMTIYSTGGIYDTRNLTHFLPRVQTIRLFVNSSTFGEVQEFLDSGRIKSESLEIVGSADPNILPLKIPTTMQGKLRRLVVRGIPIQLQERESWELVELHCSKIFLSSDMTLARLVTPSLRKLSWNISLRQEDLTLTAAIRAIPSLKVAESVKGLEMSLVVLRQYLTIGWRFPNLTHLSIKGVDRHLMSWNEAVAFKNLVGPAYQHKILTRFFAKLQLLSMVQTLELWDNEVELLLPHFLLTSTPIESRSMREKKGMPKTQDQDLTQSTSRQHDINSANAIPIALPQMSKLIVNEYEGGGEVILSIAKERNDRFMRGTSGSAMAGVKKGKGKETAGVTRFKVELRDCEISDRGVLFDLLPYRC